MQARKHYSALSTVYRGMQRRVSTAASEVNKQQQQDSIAIVKEDRNREVIAADLEDTEVSPRR